MEQNLRTVLITLSQISAFVPVCFGLLNYARLDKTFKALLVFTCIALFTEYFANWYAHNVNPNNLPPLHVYSLIEFGFLSWVFCAQLNSKAKYVVWGVLLCVAAGFAYYNACVQDGWYKMNDIARTFNSIVLTCFSLVFFLRMLRIDFPAPLQNNAAFWYTGAVFIYFSINLFFFLLFNRITDKPDGIKLMGLGIHSTVNIIANLLYAQSFRCFKQKQI